MAVKAIAVVALMMVFIGIFTAFDDTADDREQVYQEAYDETQQRLRDSQDLGELETGISDPDDDEDEDGFAEESRAERELFDGDFENEPTDDWAGVE
ncbi:hypothetical protein [Erythrobacter alti]|uniref:hypothetical protein n=1 Tax=Erythrobacter alti TaxID=1896145 RepID=UPI0030F3DF41